MPSQELQAIYDHIDRNLDDHIARLQEWIRQPSISNTGEGLLECAWLTERYFREIGCQHTEIYDPGITKWGAQGNPLVFGRCDVGAPRTLILYMMYDTMPTYDPALWRSHPLEANIVELPPFPRVIIGRGAVNSKGPQRALLNALLSIRAVTGTLPVNLLLIAEGDEERMSIGLHKFVNERRADLAGADAMLGFGGQDRQGVARLSTGSEGCVYFELETSGERWGRGPGRTSIHGIYARTVDSVAWRHIEMLGTLTRDNGGTIAIEGWYDGIEAPTEADEAMLAAALEKLDPEASRRALGIGAWRDDADPVDLLRRSVYGTSLNLDGIWGGLTTPGTAGSIMPNRVTSKHNCRYVPDQDGEDLLRKLRAHLERHGYGDVEVRVIGDVPWLRANYDTDIAHAIIRMYDEFGVDYQKLPGTGVGGFGPYWPGYLFGRDPLQLPVAMGALGHGGGAHMIDEYYVIEGAGKVYGLAGAEKGYACTLYNYAGKNE